MNREKDVALIRAARGRQRKISNLAPKKVPEMLPGQVEARMVKCGKKRCKCARGELHGPYYYHRTWDGNKHQKSYVKLSELPKTVRACKAYRDLQAELREGRAAFAALLRRARELFA